MEEEQWEEERRRDKKIKKKRQRILQGRGCNEMASVAINTTAAVSLKKELTLKKEYANAQANRLADWITTGFTLAGVHC